MAQSEGFKHITVTPPDDDDVVILAGAASDEPQAVQPANGPLGDGVGRDGEKRPGEIPHMDAASDAAEQPRQSERPPQRDRQGQRQQQRQRKDAYRETTLEDLQSTRMPLAQKIVIIAAVVCIIGAIVYYVATMG